MRHLRITNVLVLFGVAMACGTLAATKLQAGIITSENTTGYTVSNSDLLQTQLSSVVTNIGSREGEIGETALRDGSFGNQGSENTPGNPPLAAATAGTGNSILYTLNTSTNTRGYSISEIDTYAGWDGARYAQNYEVQFHILGTAAGAFTPGIFVNYQPSPINNTNNNTAAQITPNSSGPFLDSNVDEVQFTFFDANSVPAGGYQGYRELDVLGTATVPEPSAIVAICGLGAMGLFLFARRRRSL